MEGLLCLRMYLRHIHMLSEWNTLAIPLAHLVANLYLCQKLLHLIYQRFNFSLKKRDILSYCIHACHKWIRGVHV